MCLQSRITCISLRYGTDSVRVSIAFYQSIATIKKTFIPHVLTANRVLTDVLAEEILILEDGDSPPPHCTVSPLRQNASELGEAPASKPSLNGSINR